MVTQTLDQIYTRSVWVQTARSRSNGRLEQPPRRTSSRPRSPGGTFRPLLTPSSRPASANVLVREGPFTVFAPDRRRVRGAAEGHRGSSSRTPTLATGGRHPLPRRRGRVTAAQASMLRSARTLEGACSRSTSPARRSTSAVPTWSRPTSRPRTASSTSSTRCSPRGSSSGNVDRAASLSGTIHARRASSPPASASASCSAAP